MFLGQNCHVFFTPKDVVGEVFLNELFSIIEKHCRAMMLGKVVRDITRLAFYELRDD